MVNDQVGSPTYISDLAKAISALISTNYYGIYHITNSGECSWYEFTKKILEYTKIKNVKVTPILTEELNIFTLFSIMIFDFIFSLITNIKLRIRNP
ncbi:unnamed protein product [marine sediment metagenome]|uniref:RmlD-like substrate binding domain-containing protein n=1 Tax=marine sediment metagenome TaxID=412755 RepID=X1G941_9ZZZZ